MKRLEIIHLRLATDCSKDLVDNIRRSAASNTHADLKIFQHAGVAKDLGIHILHDNDDTEELPSPLGVSLASALKAHGMVEHSVWIERNEEVQ